MVLIGYVEVITSKVFGHLHDLINPYDISVLQITTDMFRFPFSQFRPLFFFNDLLSDI